MPILWTTEDDPSLIKNQWDLLTTLITLWYNGFKIGGKPVDEEKVEGLKKARVEAYQNMQYAHAVLLRAEQIVAALRKRYEDEKKVWSTADRELAIMDGRYRVVEAATSGKKKPLSRAQIEAIARELDIDLEGL